MEVAKDASWMMPLELKAFDYAELVKPFKSYLRGEGIPGEEMILAIEELSRLREALRKGLKKGECRVELYMRYLGRFGSLKKRIAMPKEGEFRFLWYNLYTKRKQVSTCGRLERVGMLYNVVACYARRGCEESRREKDGIR